MIIFTVLIVSLNAKTNQSPIYTTKQIACFAAIHQHCNN